MKRSALRRKKPIRAKKRVPRPAFGIEKNDVLLFSLGKGWFMGSVAVKGRDHVIMETATLEQHPVPLDARRLRLPDVAQIGAHGFDCEKARHARQMLPHLPSGPVLVSTDGKLRTVGPRRRKRYRKSAYLAFVRTLRPIDGGTGPTEAHHINEYGLGGDRGVGQVSDDYNTVPITASAHFCLTQTRCLPGCDRAETERRLLLGLAETRKAWIVKHEEQDTAEDIADDREAKAPLFRALSGLLAAAGVLLLLLFSLTACTEPGPAALHIQKGRAHLKMLRPGLAEYHARQALQHRYPPGAAYILLGDALRAQNRCPQARPEYLRAWEVLPGDADALAGFCACHGDKIGEVACPAPLPVAQATGGPS